MTTIDLKGKDKAAVLARLYNAAKPQGMGFLQHTPGDMTVAEAREILGEATYFDYHQGRVMKVDLGGDSLDTRLYDRDNGDGAAAAALRGLG